MPIDDLDVWRAANILIKQHRENAAIVAAQRADECAALRMRQVDSPPVLAKRYDRTMRLTVSILVVLGIFGIAALILYLDYGTVAPCGILRERFRQQAIREGGSFGGFVVTALPDNVLDGMLAAQYGALTPGRCINLLADGAPQQHGGNQRRQGSPAGR